MVFDYLEVRIATIDEQLAELKQRMVDNFGNNAMVDELSLQNNDL